MDYFEDVWYHGDIEKENPFLMLLAASTEDEMDMISKGDKFMSDISDKVKRLNEDDDILDVIIENEDEIIANSMYERGVLNGISQKAFEIARKMLEMNIDINIICETTGLTEEEIRKLK